VGGPRVSDQPWLAGASTFDLSRYTGTSLAMNDRHYGHLARDDREQRDQTARYVRRRRSACRLLAKRESDSRRSNLEL
jgi:hypothetical protein